MKLLAIPKLAALSHAPHAIPLSRAGAFVWGEFPFLFSFLFSHARACFACYCAALSKLLLWPHPLIWRFLARRMVFDMRCNCRQSCFFYCSQFVRRSCFCVLRLVSSLGVPHAQPTGTSGDPSPSEGMLAARAGGYFSTVNVFL